MKRSDAEPTKRFVPTAAVLKRYNRCRETIRRWQNDPRVDFPKPVKLGPGDRGPNSYVENELDDYDERAAKRSGK
jgi:predicted DNA-binding transcriptional regulator AlpA